MTMITHISLIGVVFFAGVFIAGATSDVDSNVGKIAVGADKTPETSTVTVTPPSTAAGNSTDPPTTHVITTQTTPTTSPTTKPTVSPTTKPTVPPTSPPTSSQAPPTTAKPSPPKPDSHIGRWNVTQGNSTCIRFDAEIEVNLAYTDKNNKTDHYALNVPTNATASGLCGTGSELMQLNWANNTAFNFTFAYNQNEFYVKSVSGFIDVNDFADLKNKTNASNYTVTYLSKENNELLKASGNNSYVCTSPAALAMNNGSELLLSSLQYQAFISNKAGAFGPAQNCISESPDIVPILVAGLLILVVVLVLVAYVITRRRSRAQGYLSM